MSQRTRRSIEPSLEARLDALQHQEEALVAMRDLPYGAIFHEQGLGKTKIAIDLVLYWLEKKSVDAVLIVTKKSLIKNWTDEFRVHSHIRPRVISQDQRSNFYIFNSPARVLLTHFEVVRTERRMLELYLKTRSVAIIIDESAKIKNPNSALTKAYFELAPLFAKRFIMTGTPIANRPFDLWAQIFFLDQGQSLGRDFEGFRSKLDLSNSLSTNLEKRAEFEGQLGEVFSRIEKFAVRKTKKSADLKLPEKSVHAIQTDWEPRQSELYQGIRKELRAVVIHSGIPTEDRADSLLKRMLRLVQVASNPAMIDSSYHAKPGKFEFLLDILSAAFEKNEKAIVWTNFTENADWLRKNLDRFGATQVHGKLPIDVRNQHIENFKKDPEVRVLVATPGSAKEGLTLTNANHVVFYDKGFSLDDYLQAQDRIHRISQTRPCHVYNLVMRDSIDEWIETLLESKLLAAQLAQRDISMDYYRSQIRYDFGEIMRRILGLKKKGEQSNGE